MAGIACRPSSAAAPPAAARCAPQVAHIRCDQAALPDRSYPFSLMSAAALRPLLAVTRAPQLAHLRAARTYRALPTAARAHSSSPAAPAAGSTTMDAAARGRARAAVLGSFLADAATMPLHWICECL